MGVYVGIALITMAGGWDQAVTGFGGGIVIMVVLPSLLTVGLAPAVSGTICSPLTWMIAWRYHRFIKPKQIIFPVICYIAASCTAIELSTRIDMERLKPVFGLFLVVLAIYFMVFSDRMKVKGTWLSALVCSAISGFLGGLFGIGGPMLVLYFLAVSKTKEEYLGNINGVFAITTLQQLITRISVGILTWEAIPAILVGMVFVLIGRFWGSRVVDKLDVARMKRGIYIFLIIAGVLTVAGSL